ncbi:30S ribosomal protein S8 [Patescibacteria group bacterium]
MSSDPIADLITKIRNGLMVQKNTITVPYSQIKENLANVLVAEGYLHKVKKTEEEGHPALEIVLKYVDKEPAIREIKRVSKPGHRIYRSSKELSKVYQGLGVGIVTTPQGIFTSREARSKGLGGELICQVW